MNNLKSSKFFTRKILPKITFGIGWTVDTTTQKIISNFCYFYPYDVSITIGSKFSLRLALRQFVTKIKTSPQECGLF